MSDRTGYKTEIANTCFEQDLGATAFSVSNECERYGMCHGCDVDCPVLLRGECELQDTDNKELYEEAISI